MDAEQTIAEIEWLERILALSGAGHQTAESERPLGCESTTVFLIIRLRHG